MSDDDSPGHVHLRDTIRVETDEATGAATLIAGDPSRGVDYAALVNNGHATRGSGYVPGTFFFENGVEAAKSEAKRVAEDAKSKG